MIIKVTEIQICETDSLTLPAPAAPKLGSTVNHTQYLLLALPPSAYMTLTLYDTAHITVFSPA